MSNTESKRARHYVKKSHYLRLPRRHPFLVIVRYRYTTKIRDGCTYIVILIGTAIKIKMPPWTVSA